MNSDGTEGKKEIAHEATFGTVEDSRCIGSCFGRAKRDHQHAVAAFALAVAAAKCWPQLPPDVPVLQFALLRSQCFWYTYPGYERPSTVNPTEPDPPIKSGFLLFHVDGQVAIDYEVTCGGGWFVVGTRKNGPFVVNSGDPPTVDPGSLEGNDRSVCQVVHCVHLKGCSKLKGGTELKPAPAGSHIPEGFIPLSEVDDEGRKFGQYESGVKAEDPQAGTVIVHLGELALTLFPDRFEVQRKKGNRGGRIVMNCHAQEFVVQRDERLEKDSST